MLAELKAALGDDPARFARTVAKPILVEHELRERFENDDKLHAPQRRQMEAIRERLLLARKSGSSAGNLVALLKREGTNQITETTWEFGCRPSGRHEAESPDELEIKKRFGPNAQILAPLRGEAEREGCFQELPAPLQQVLGVQLHKAGDVSAVIELPGGFAFHLAKERTTEVLSVATLSIPKRSYEQWLAEQMDKRP